MSGLVGMARALIDAPDEADKHARDLWQALIYLDEHAQELAKVWQTRTGNKEDPDLRMLILWAAEELKKLRDTEGELADEIERRQAAEETVTELSKLIAASEMQTEPDGQVQVEEESGS